MVRRMLRCICLTLSFSFVSFTGAAVAAEHGDVGVVVLHGKWGSADGRTSGLADFLSNEGFRVAKPEMPWSGKRAYDAGAESMVAEINNAVSKLRSAGAQKIYILGHSQGAVGSLYYAGQQQVDGVVLIAAGGHAQNRYFVENYASAVSEAKKLVAHGKGGDQVSFKDLNTGGRVKTIKSPAQSVVDYFDPSGPFNSELSATRVKSGARVLIVAPNKEGPSIKKITKKIEESLPAGIKKQTVEIDSDHLHAPDASRQVVRDWLLAN